MNKNTARNSAAIMNPLSKKAFSVLRTISGLADVRYMNLIMIYNDIGIVKMTIYSMGVAVPGMYNSNLNIR